MKKYNKTVHLSVQQLTDCSSDLNYGNDGCKGGNVWNAYRYIYENGIIEEKAYPFYSGIIGDKVTVKIKLIRNNILKRLKKKGQCRFKNGSLDGKPYTGTVYKINSFFWVNQGDDLALIEVLDQYGPVSVSLDSSSPKFVSYSSGVLNKAYNESKESNIGYKILI
jgi:cathepsin L